LDVYYRPAADLIDWKLFQALLRRMKACCAGAGAQFLFYHHPALEEVWDPYAQDLVAKLGVRPEQYDRYALQKRLQGAASQAGVDYCPLIDYFRTRPDRGPFHLLPRDPHCNAAGYQLTAEALADHLAAHQYFPKQRVRTTAP
jgi:hypothetical protein